MYASTEHVHGHYAVPDQRAISQRAAERHQQLTAVAEARRSDLVARREARAEHRRHSVAVA